MFGTSVCFSDSLFQLIKAFTTDGMLHPAGVRLCGFWINTCADELLGKEAVAFVNFFGNLATHFRQMQKMIFVHPKKTAVPKDSHRMAHTGL